MELFSERTEHISQFIHDIELTDKKIIKDALSITISFANFLAFPFSYMTYYLEEFAKVFINRGDSQGSLTCPNDGDKPAEVCVHLKALYALFCLVTSLIVGCVLSAVCSKISNRRSNSMSEMLRILEDEPEYEIPSDSEDGYETDRSLEIDLPKEDHNRLTPIPRSFSAEGLLEEERSKRLCVVCRDNVKSVLIMPCKHLCLCVSCAKCLAGMGPRRRICPLCRRSFKSITNVYL